MQNLKNFYNSHTQTIKLAATYLLVIMFLSFVFSLALYNASTRNLGRQKPPRSILGRAETKREFEELLEARDQEIRNSVASSLVVLNLAMLVFGAGVSWLLARSALGPIEEIMDKQTQFVSDASHEIRTPLTVLQTTNEVALRNKKLKVSEARDVLSENLEEISKMRILSDSLLGLLGSKNSVQISEVDVVKAAKNSVGKFKKQAEAKKIKLTANSLEQKFYAKTDQTKLEQILNIFLDNAIKYSGQNTEVSVSILDLKKSLQISVADQGPGIDSSERELIFERLYRADSSRNSEGFGLGLAIAKQAAESIHAEISIASNQPQGSVFSIKLPKSWTLNKQNKLLY